MDSDITVETGALGPVVRPHDAAETVVLYIHGRQDLEAGPGAAVEVARLLAPQVDATVACCRYGLPFETALADVQAAYSWCQERGPVVVIGERMGAGLAVELLVRLRDDEAQLPECAILISSLFDLTTPTKSLPLNVGGDPSFDAVALRRRMSEYAGETRLTDARVNPLYANLHGLPPIQLLVASADPLLDNSLSFAGRAAHDRVPLDLKVWPERVDFRAETVTAMTAFITAHRTTRPQQREGVFE